VSTNNVLNVISMFFLEIKEIVTFFLGKRYIKDSNHPKYQYTIYHFIGCIDIISILIHMKGIVIVKTWLMNI
jgi:hypothetical protein